VNQSFGKAYKLCSKNIIDEIFESGETVKSYPLLAKYKFAKLNGETSFQIVISAPKRTFRNAHQRNKIKRLCTEAIRKNKTPLESVLKAKDKQLGIFLIYSAKDVLTAQQVERKTEKLFNKLIDQLNETN
jgi:ribonuclease P protein component